MQTLLQDFRFAFKTLRSRPGLSGAIVVTLALAIGTNSTIFSWVNRVLLDPLPGVDTAPLVEFQQSSPLGSFSMSYPEYLDYRYGATKVLLSGREDYAMDLGVNNQVERIWGQIVTENFFDVLNLKPALGRGFLPEDARPLESPVVVISYGLWERKFAGDPSVVGRAVQLNGHPFTIVGVTPQGFIGSTVGLKSDLFVPMAMEEQVIPGGNRLERRGTQWFRGLARLSPKASIEQATAEMNAIVQGIAEKFPEYKDVKVALTPIAESENGGVPILRPVLLAMMTVVALILLIACANIANLLLARATARRREIAIRLSMGATRVRLVRQLLTEGLVLAIAGATFGLILTGVTGGLLNRFAPPSDLPVVLDASLDYRVVGFTIAITLTATLLFALVPALRLSSMNASESMKEGSAGAGTRSRLRSGLVVVQVAMSLSLLVAAGLCVRSLRNMESYNPGFNKDGVLLASIDLFPAGYDVKSGTALFSRLLDELQTIPGVTSFTLARHVPLGLTGLSSSSVEVDGYTPTSPNDSPFAGVTTIGPNYFGVMNIPLVAGRDIQRSDDRGGPSVAVISETMAKHYWPNRNAIGERFRFGSNSSWITVVGVAKDMKWRNLKERSRAFVYLPVLQAFAPATVIHLRTSGDPEQLAGPLREAVRRVAPQLPVFGIRTLEGHVSAASFQPNMASRLLGAFGILALTLAALGLYGVLAFLVGQRTREIGIRMTLGAMPRDVFRLVVRHGLLLTGVGAGIGVAGAYGLAQAMASLLFGVSPSDPLTLTLSVLLLILTALAACLIPAYRATRVDPASALRWE
jgi:putative ABC transport system permease protein